MKFFGILISLTTLFGLRLPFSRPVVSTSLPNAKSMHDAIPTSIKSKLTGSSILKNSLKFSSIFLPYFYSSIALSSASIYPLYGPNDLMKPKQHGTSSSPVQSNLRWNCDNALADRICNYNRNWAEFAGYWTTTSFLKETEGLTEAITFYDSVTGVPLFIAPKGRSFDDWKGESLIHGWPSFRDNEVVWTNVRCLKGGEVVSLTGTHLGHNLPDRSGNRYRFTIGAFNCFDYF